jgi:hypothetical protein
MFSPSYHIYKFAHAHATGPMAMDLPFMRLEENFTILL